MPGFPGFSGYATTTASPAGSLLLKASTNGRYLVNALERPFFPHFDIPWAINEISLTAAKAYLDDAKSKGFNGIRVMGPIHMLSEPRSDVNGNFAFTTPDDFTTTFVEAYWNHWKAIISEARDRSLLTSIVCNYFGFGGDGSQGWWPVVNAKTSTQNGTYATAFANRFAAYENVLFEVGGDFVPPELTRLTAMVNSLRAVSPARLITSEPERPGLSSEYQPTSGNWNLQFAYAPVANAEVLYDAWNENVGPVVLWEPYYEHRASPAITVQQVRSQFWSAVSSGACSYAYGNERIYTFGGGWANTTGNGTNDYTENLNDPGRVTVGAAGAWFRSQIEWQKLVPSQGAALVTAGRGTLGTEAYVTAALASDGSFALIYIPDADNSITVQCNQLSGAVTATWVDPSNPSLTASGGSGLTGSQVFSRTAQNAAGNDDWVLLLRVP